jgi:hypothetical protein
MFVSTATGLILFCSAAASAEQKDAVIAVPEAQRTEARPSGMEHKGLTGGFYADKDKSDDWYYDFYENSPAERTSDRTAAARSSRIRPDAIKVAGKTQFVDAASPADVHASDPHGQGVAVNQYYDDPWYYEQRDTSYTMPVKAASDNSRASTTQTREVLKGNVIHVKQVRNATSGGQNTVVQMKPLKGNPTIVDLGPTQPLLNLALAEGDSIAVSGPSQHIGQYSVLMANQVKSGANEVFVDRGETAVASDRKEATGRIERISDVRIRGTEQMHRVAAIRGDDGRSMLIDLGAATASGSMPPTGATGDQIKASGPVATVGNYPVLFADHMSIDNGVPIAIARPDGAYPGAPRHDMESLQVHDSPNAPQPVNQAPAK